MQTENQKCIKIHIIPGPNGANEPLSKEHKEVLFLSPRGNLNTSDYPHCPLVIVRESFKGFFHAVQIDRSTGNILEKEKHSGPMFGGCFVWSSDGRFPFDHPVKLHDRYEKSQALRM